MRERIWNPICLAIVTLMTMGFWVKIAHGQEAAPAQDNPSVVIWRSIAAAACIAIAATAGAFAQSKAAQTALEGIARNPGASSKIFTPMLLGLALIESLVIYALIIAFILAT